MEASELTVKEKIGYGTDDAGYNIVFGTVMLFVNCFYTDIFGLAPAPVGVLLLSVRAIDAVTDPIMGVMADRTRSKYDRFRPWLLWMALPYALFSILMFTTPEWTYDSKVVYAFVTYFLLPITYTAVNIPCCSLGNIITNDPEGCIAYQPYRFVLVDIATLLLSLILLPMADWLGGKDEAKGYRMATAVLAFIDIRMFLFCFATVRERIRPAVRTNDGLKVDLKDMWENDQWVKILLLTPCNVCPGFVRMAAAMYYVIWVIQQNTQFVTLFINLGVVGMMIGNTLAKVLTDHWCKLKVFFWTSVILAIFSTAFCFFDPKATMMIMVLYFPLNILYQIPSPLHWSLMADVGDYGGWKTGKRITGVSFSGNLFFPKLGLAIAGVMVGFLPSWYGYDAGAKTQDDFAISGIMLLFTIIPSVGYLITADVVRLLKTGCEFMQQVQTGLGRHRANYRELSKYHDIKTTETIRKA